MNHNSLGTTVPTDLNEIPREIEHLAHGISAQHELLAQLETRLANVLRPVPKIDGTKQPPQPAPVTSNLGNDIMIQRGRIISTNDRLITILDSLTL